MRASRKEWMGLLILIVPTLLISMDMTVTYLALPVLSAALKPSSAELLWVTDIFGFMEAGLLIVMGSLGDRIGLRKLLLSGAFAFTAASPLIDLQLFADSRFNVALTALFVALFTWSGIFLFVGQYLQSVLGLPSFDAGLWMLPGSAGSILLCMLAPVALKYFSRGAIMTAGLSITAAVSTSSSSSPPCRWPLSLKVRPRLLKRFHYISRWRDQIYGQT